MNHKVFKMTWKLVGSMVLVVGWPWLSVAAAVGNAEKAPDDLVSDLPAGRIESLVVEVNGERRMVDPKLGIHVVLGDLVTIIDAYLFDKATPVKAVDLVGFRSKISSKPHDDRGRVVDTGRSLTRSRSESGRGDRYRIEVSSAAGIQGMTFLNLKNPELILFELEINGQALKLMDGDVLKLSANDKVKVLGVHTNVRGNENVKYDKVSARGTKEIRFSRGERVFARIPVEWQGP